MRVCFDNLKKKALPLQSILGITIKILLNSAFATELGDFIADSRIDVWIFGHSHANIDATIGNTRIVSNQMGYVYYGEHLQDFKGDKFIEL